MVGRLASGTREKVEGRLDSSWRRDGPQPAETPDDELIEQASAAMHKLAIHVHYQACEKVKQRPKPK